MDCEIYNQEHLYSEAWTVTVSDEDRPTHSFSVQAAHRRTAVMRAVRALGADLQYKDPADALYLINEIETWKSRDGRFTLTVKEGN